MRHPSPSKFTESQLARKEVLHCRYIDIEVTRDILCRSKRIFGEKLGQNTLEDSEGCPGSVSVFVGCAAFSEATQLLLHGRKRHSEISESAPASGCELPCSPILAAREI
jgi:hypothetical protein